MVEAVYEPSSMLLDSEFGFIVGKGSRGMEDDSTSDEKFVKELENRDKAVLVADLGRFCKLFSDSTIVFINQPAPNGFVDTVLWS